MLIYKGPLAHDTHCPLEDKDKDKEKDKHKDKKSSAEKAHHVQYLWKAGGLEYKSYSGQDVFPNVNVIFIKFFILIKYKYCNLLQCIVTRFTNPIFHVSKWVGEPSMQGSDVDSTPGSSVGCT